MTESLLPRELFDPLRRVLAQKRVMYIPNPGNVGDQLIAASTRNFFNEILTEVVDDWERAELLVCAGGGSLGTLYPKPLGIRQEKLWEAHERGLRCVILPQSLTQDGEEFPPDTIIFAREKLTLSRISGSILVPDMALSFRIERSILPKPEHETGVFLRRDIERASPMVRNLGDPAAMTSSWQEYVSLAARYQHVITDRLHFAIGALLAGREATLLANSYPKNRSIYDAWLANIGCKWLDDPSEAGLERFVDPYEGMEMSLVCFQSGNFAGCIAAARSVIEVRPDHAGAWNNICAALNQLGRFKEAKEAGEEALRLLPDFALAKGNLEVSLEELRKLE